MYEKGWTRVIKHNEYQIAIYLALNIKETMNYKYDLQLLDYNNNFDFWVYEPLNMLFYSINFDRDSTSKRKGSAWKIKTLIDWSYSKSEDKTLFSSVWPFKWKFLRNYFMSNVKCQMFVYSGHALSYTKLVHRHATETEGNKYFKWT